MNMELLHFECGFTSVGALSLIFVIACISMWVAEAVYLANVSWY